MNQQPRQFGRSSDRWQLRGGDQATLAVLLVLALAAVVAEWVLRGGRRGELVDLDRAPRREVAFQLDINAADWPEWTVLPGVGETTARRIVLQRQTHGPFLTHEDLLRVPGIGPRTLERLRPYLMPVRAAAQPESIAAPAAALPRQYP